MLISQVLIQFIRYLIKVYPRMVTLICNLQQID